MLYRTGGVKLTQDIQSTVKQLFEKHNVSETEQLLVLEHMLDKLKSELNIEPRLVNITTFGDACEGYTVYLNLDTDKRTKVKA